MVKESGYVTGYVCLKVQTTIPEVINPCYKRNEHVFGDKRHVSGLSIKGVFSRKCVLGKGDHVLMGAQIIKARVCKTHADFRLPLKLQTFRERGGGGWQY